MPVRSMAVCPSEAVIAGAVGDRLMSQLQRLWDGKERAWCRITAARMLRITVADET